MLSTKPISKKRGNRSIVTKPLPIDILETQLGLIASFNAWLDQQLHAGRDYDGITTRLRAHFTAYEAHLLLAKDTLRWARPAIADWVPIKCTANSAGAGREEDGDGDDCLTVVVTGPSAEDCFEVRATDQEQLEHITGTRFIGYIASVCREFARVAKSIDTLCETIQSTEDEKAQLSQPPQTTVREHIRLLREYNDMKDIGQQLIGLIAENRGVLIGSLYEDAQYGVTSDD